MLSKTEWLELSAVRLSAQQFLPIELFRFLRASRSHVARAQDGMIEREAGNIARVDSPKKFCA
jgi:hypothetical protein